MQESSVNYIYRQLYNDLKDDILAYKYESHEKLPSKRAMAQHANISVNSVKAAYEQLLEEGYIYTQERKGYYIEPLEQLIVKPQTQIQLEDYYREAAPQYQYSFSHMSTNIENFPMETWLKLQKQVFRQFTSRLSSIPEFKGPMELRQTIAKLVSYKRGIHCHPEQIIIGSGTNVLLKQLLDVMEEDSKIAVENPGYSRFRDLLNRSQKVTIPVSLDNKGISIKALKALNPNLVIVTPSHQFPMGTIMPISRRIDLLNWMTQTNGYIVEDDYDSEFKYNTDNIPSLYSFDKSGRVIYLGTFSKTLMPGLRLSYMILPTSLVKRFETTNHNVIPDFSMLNALTLYMLIKDGHYERYIKKMHHIYEEKRIKLIIALKKEFKDKITIKDTKAGLHFIVEVKTNYSYTEIESRAHEHQVELYTINRFTVEPVGETTATKTLIIGFANIDLTTMSKAVSTLKAILIK
ncbi:MULTISPECIES: PLP-dependent aminotransferase family protein [unclassified Staphylococcus]|uniref:MocR-like transcriptional regulator GabR n=1 Tax=unclassified Staphylococcus TaxID=91994 RepID=UPI001AEC65C1|nr:MULTISPECIES: PLP-dependent aminotransferase family protein [unclassified Staphylococcus]